METLIPKTQRNVGHGFWWRNVLVTSLRSWCPIWDVGNRFFKWESHENVTHITEKSHLHYYYLLYIIILPPTSKTVTIIKSPAYCCHQDHSRPALFMGQNGELEYQSWFYFCQFHVIGFLGPNLVHPVSDQMGRSKPLECEINSISSFFSYKYRFK